MYIYTGEEMSALDRRVIEVYNIPSLILMENAARGVFEEIVNQFSSDASITIFCGTGNNGGDGLALARQLFCAGYRPEVFIAGEESKIKEPGKTHLASLRALKVPTHILREESNFIEIEKKLSVTDLICDAILGTACNRNVEGMQKSAIELINALPAIVYALDVPSGINSKSGKICGVAVNAQKTICFGGLKRGLLLFPGAEIAGEIILKDIGFPPCAVEEMPTNLRLLDVDGLNILAEDLELIEKLKERTTEIILTPNIDEMARLMNCDKSVITDDLVGAVQNLSKQHNVITILKNATTVIALPDGTAYLAQADAAALLGEYISVG